MAYSLQTVEDDMAAFVATEFPKNTIKAGTYLYHTGFKDTMDTTRKNIHFGLEPSISIWYGLEKLEDALYTKRVPADKHKMFLKENPIYFYVYRFSKDFKYDEYVSDLASNSCNTNCLHIQVALHGDPTIYKDKETEYNYNFTLELIIQNLSTLIKNGIIKKVEKSLILYTEIQQLLGLKYTKNEITLPMIYDWFSQDHKYREKIISINKINDLKIEEGVDVYVDVSKSKSPPKQRTRSKSPKQRTRSKSPKQRTRSKSPKQRTRSKSPLKQSMNPDFFKNLFSDQSIQIDWSALKNKFNLGPAFNRHKSPIRKSPICKLPIRKSPIRK
jgi:hypothetical protein